MNIFKFTKKIKKHVINKINKYYLSNLNIIINEIVT